MNKKSILTFIFSLLLIFSFTSAVSYRINYYRLFRLLTFFVRGEETYDLQPLAGVVPAVQEESQEEIVENLQAESMLAAPPPTPVDRLSSDNS